MTNPHAHLLYKLPEEIKNDNFLAALNHAVSLDDYKNRGFVVAYDPTVMKKPAGMIRYCCKECWYDVKRTRWDFIFSSDFKPLSVLPKFGRSDKPDS